jgi:hypothetical protein
MIGILKALITPIASVASNVIEARSRSKELKAAKHIKELEGIQAADAAEFFADNKRQEGLSSSWKDEYITIIISIPLILSFLGPEYAAIVEEGFEALKSTPDYYQWLVIAVFSVGAGVPLASKTVKTIQSIRRL